MEGRSGLDYPAVEIVLQHASGRRSGFRWRDKQRLWAEIRALEIGAVNAWAEDRKTRQGNADK